METECQQCGKPLLHVHNDGWLRAKHHLYNWSEGSFHFLFCPSCKRTWVVASVLVRTEMLTTDNGSYDGWNKEWQEFQAEIHKGFTVAELYSPRKSIAKEEGKA